MLLSYTLLTMRKITTHTSSRASCSMFLSVDKSSSIVFVVAVRVAMLKFKKSWMFVSILGTQKLSHVTETRRSEHPPNLTLRQFRASVLFWRCTTPGFLRIGFFVPAHHCSPSVHHGPNQNSMKVSNLRGMVLKGLLTAMDTSDSFRSERDRSGA